MGACCGKKAEDEEKVVENKQLDKERFDISKGPLDNRRCTDILCTLIYILHVAAFIVAVCFGGFTGNPFKLYWPRDFRGDYCGAQTQWNNGPDLSSHTHLVFTMNTSQTMELIAKQFVCSSAVETMLRSRDLLTAADWQEYTCACCKEPCGSCIEVLPVADLLTPSAVSEVLSGKMMDLSIAGKAADLLASGGHMLRSLGRIFHGVCTKSCGSTSYSGSDWREYRYTPHPDASWKKAWDTLLNDNHTDTQELAEVVRQNFTLRALPHSECPYPASYCVPFPGATFQEVLGTGFCSAGSFIMEGAATAVNDVQNSGAVKGVLDALQAEEAFGRAKESLGSLVGNILATLDVLAIVATIAIIVSLVYLVMLRFFVRCVVWSSLSVVFFLTVLGGGAAFVRSHQCVGTNFLGTVSNYGVWASTTAVQLADQLESTRTVEWGLESATGDGSDYRGLQRRTRSGRTCAPWTSNHTALWNTSDLRENFCRNPNGAVFIWCYTTDPDTRWELCNPITVAPFMRECMQGYVVQDETGRKALQVFAYVLFGVAFLWLLFVLCNCKRIRLAININIVAAKFVYSHPHIVAVPLIQAFLGIAYCFTWAIAASMILAEVPKDGTPTASFESWAVAYGTQDTPGQCTSSWPTGSVWKYAGDITSADDPCSGVFGNTTGMTPRCWRCAPPRFALDWRFAAAFFALLWNNALLIAFGQCIVAGACAIWFFKGKGQKVVSRSTYNCFRYHFGSLALGSFVIATVQFIRYCLMYMQKQAEAQKNKVMQVVLKVLSCCMYCLEKCLKFLTKHAYIQVAIMGTSFCTSAKNAFFLLARNCMRFGMLEMLGFVMEWLGFAVIICFTAVLGFFTLDAIHPEVDPIGPMILYVILGYVAAELFISVFSLAVDSMLQCFIAAEEMQVTPETVPVELRRLLPDYKPCTE